MLPEFLTRLNAMAECFCGYQYQLDHTECVTKMIEKIARGVKGRLILDANNFYHSSCARQPIRVKSLFEAGCEIHLLKPKGGSFSCMHIKMLIFDNEIALSGSTNMTHNGMENNKEHLYRFADAHLVEAMLKDFDTEWEATSKVSREEIDHMLSLYERREQKKREGKTLSLIHI